jgi:hypothetical protein
MHERRTIHTMDVRGRECFRHSCQSEKSCVSSEKALSL